jgi:nickel transport protein
MNRQKARTLIVVCLAAFLWSASNAWAHKVSVFAYVQGDSIVVEGYFSGMVPAVNSDVKVFDRKGAKLTEGRTDSKGLFSFPISDLGGATAPIRFVLNAEMGHRADYSLSSVDLPPGVIKAGPPKESSTGKKVVDKNPAAPELKIEDAAAMKKIVADAVKEQLQPLVTMVGDQQRLLLEEKDPPPSLAEIIGGIGWIFGIAGVWAYFAARKRMTGQ